MRLRRGQIVAVEFLDHVSGDSAPLTFVVYGRLVAVNPESITVASWVYSDEEKAKDLTDRKQETYTLVRSAIKSVRQLRAIDG